jgi:ABC-type multidrug transport system ATPase subunit
VGREGTAVVIRTRGLVKKYGAFTAVDGIDLGIQPGEIYGFLGPNGAGKTTTIMMLLGITRPTAGEISLFGERFTSDRLDLRRRIGVVPEKHPRGAWQWMTAVEYLGMFADLFRVPRADSRIQALLEKVDLRAVRNRRIGTFSHGMLQKLSITRALLHDPDILFLDEPISGLDPLGIKQTRDLLVSENRAGRAIFISSHQLSEMERLCHRVAIISRGRLMAENTVAGLLSRMGTGREIRVELESVPADLPAALGRLPMVRGVRVLADGVAVQVPVEGDHRKAVSSLLVQRGLIPLRIDVVSPSLEEAFITITQETVAKLGEAR